jgi:hypothetical protein
MDCGGQPFFSFTTKTKPEACKCRDVIPVILNLTFVNPGDEFQFRNCILACLTVKLQTFNHFLFKSDISVGQNLLCQLCSGILLAGSTTTCCCWTTLLRLMPEPPAVGLPLPLFYAILRVYCWGIRVVPYWAVKRSCWFDHLCLFISL